MTRDFPVLILKQKSKCKRCSELKIGINLSIRSIIYYEKIQKGRKTKKNRQALLDINYELLLKIRINFLILAVCTNINIIDNLLI